jgi:type II secretory ATPase GspE/PulE/Tfp pilus assembly ATPase PilB-like protein
MAVEAHWSKSFVITDAKSGSNAPGGCVRLCQIGLKDFVLESTVRYVGAQTGLEGKMITQ